MNYVSANMTSELSLERALYLFVPVLVSGRVFVSMSASQHDRRSPVCWLCWEVWISQGQMQTASFRRCLS